jgi:hypothetical protein
VKGLEKGLEKGPEKGQILSRYAHQRRRMISEPAPQRRWPPG